MNKTNRTITVKDTPELIMSLSFPGRNEVLYAHQSTPDRFYAGELKKQSSYKLIRRAVRGFSKPASVQRTSKPSKRKTAVYAVVARALASAKARFGNIETLHAHSMRSTIFLGQTSTGKTTYATQLV
jgi:DNA replication protein DnaC